MTRTLWIIVLAMTAMAGSAYADEEGPRTGYHYKRMTIVEIAGEQGAQSLASVFEPDQKLAWQVYVPEYYDPGKPAGVMVFLTYKPNWGGGDKKYNRVSDERNLIWAGLLGAGDKVPLNERMLRAIITPTMLAKEYALDPERIYIGGFSGGAHVASILATAKPELFKGGLFVSGALFWEDKEPPKLDLVRQNRYVFVTGSIDPGREDVRNVARAYQAAGVADTELIVRPNQKREMLSGKVFERVISYLDGGD